jgi:excinuclease ABC subunit A
MSHIEIINAKKHNLKNLNLIIPKKQLITITGVSGSGKSTLAYDTIFQEGQRKYLESLSTYARQFIKSLEKPQVQAIRGIAPTIAIDQKHTSYYYNSTVGTISEISQYLRLLFARVAKAHCPECGKPVTNYSTSIVKDYIYDTFSGKLVYIFAPVVKNRKGNYNSLFEKFIKRGFLKALIDGQILYLDDMPALKVMVPHDIAIQVDAIKVKEENRKRLIESLDLASFESGGEMIVMQDKKEYFFSHKLYCQDCHISIKEPQPATFSLNSPIAVCSACKGRGLLSDSGGEPCPQCNGSGFNTWALSFYFKGKNIHQLGQMELSDLLHFFLEKRHLTKTNKLLEPLLPQIIQRLESFVKLKLGYITLNRKVNTLSGGELQRTRLVSQIGFSLSGIIYILDEPSIGMHPTEQQNLIDILFKLKERDNTIIVVEHDRHTIGSSDYIIDLGPGAGEEGGNLTYCGWYKDFEKATGSLTSDYMFNRKTISLVKPYTFKLQDPSLINISGISINNINNAALKIPLNALTVVTGVSGSGKSSIIMNAFYPIIRSIIQGTRVRRPGLKYSKISASVENQRIMMVTQTAIGKNSRSCPATYINIMPLIRELFAGLIESKIRGYNARRFSFNAAGGRCESCKGMGFKKLEMSFLPDLEVPCPVCEGKRFNSETLQAKFNGLSIADVLALTAEEAFKLFQNIPFLAKKIKILMDVGLGYLKLGQSSITLSGGESQRIKLTRELSRLANKPTIYLLDEPTIGLHFDDIGKLLELLYSLVARGNTVIVIEHNIDVIRAADYIVEMGPGGGKNGGRILYQGASY